MYNKISNKQKDEIKKQFEETVEEINENDIVSASEDGLKKINELDNNPPKVLKNIWENVKMMVYMMLDYINGNYRNINWKTIAIISGAIIYFVSPLDLIPDVIPFVGFLDDLTVINIALEMTSEEFTIYKAWKITQL
jgi:uncharacterized membrane protein YkvA (DUF1232 family)